MTDKGGLTPAQVGFNTPPYRVNFSIGNRNVSGTGFGFNVAWRYQESFVWQSSFVSLPLGNAEGSFIPQFNTLDAQISKKITSIKSILKVGGTNIMGNNYFTGWGNPTIGSMFYIGLTFDELLNK
jgi:iron complex outermembrane recepter protein